MTATYPFSADSSLFQAAANARHSGRDAGGAVFALSLPAAEVPAEVRS
jgi:hypothetical protein